MDTNDCSRYRVEGKTFFHQIPSMFSSDQFYKERKENSKHSLTKRNLST